MIWNLSVGTLTAFFLLVLFLLAAAFSGRLTRQFGINFRDHYGRNGYLGHLQKRLLRAGFFIRSEELIAFSLSLALLLAASALLLELGFFPALLLGLGGYLSPFFILDYRRARKLRKFEKQLPPALSIIANGLRSGYSFAQALEVVHQDTLPPLSDEFGRVIRDNRLGRPMGEALKRMADRIGSADLDTVVSSLEVQRQMGGNMAVLVEKMEQTLRDRTDLQEEIKSLTAQQRFSAILIFLLPFILAGFLLISNPQYLQPLVEEPLGRILLGSAVIAQFIGLIILSRFMKINY